MDEAHGPLPGLLLVLTAVTGLVDAVSYLQLGRVFVANMTGNVVFLGFAVADAPAFSLSASLAALAAFLVGAFVGGTIGARVGRHRARLLAVSTGIQVVFVGAALALALAIAGPVAQGRPVGYALIVLLALAMGLQNATARRLAVPDLTTTVLTMTLTGFAADASLAGGKQPRAVRRLQAAATMWLGAATGALLLPHAGIAAVLGLALALLVFTGMAGVRHWASSAAWTPGP
jgi:uncharacterized membrane protein YoaK (UPF0700 family)